jgi:hypothetical protein
VVYADGSPLFEEIGEENQVTTIEFDWAQAVTQPVETVAPTEVAASTEPTVTESFRLTRAILRELGSCGPYIRRFSDTFPRERYPDGVEINQETCTTHFEAFDWTWACRQMLNQSGRELYEQLVRSRAEVNRHFGTGDRRRAAVFGHVFATRGDLRNEVIATVRTAAQEREDREAIQEVDGVRNDIRYLESEIKAMTERLAYQRERLPHLEKSLAGALARQAKIKHQEAIHAFERLQERAARGAEAVQAAAAELARLTALTEPEGADEVVTTSESSS